MSTHEVSLCDVQELSARTGVSVATIWRLKRTGKIPYFQPGGPRSLVRFPADALERSTASAPLDPAAKDAVAPYSSPQRLPGPNPSWMSHAQK